MEMTTEVREDPLEELADSNWPVKAGYGGGARKDIVALKRVVVKQACRSYFHTDDRNWTENPWRYKEMKRVSVANREVVDTVMKFNDKIPTKGLVRIYNSVHPIVDIKGHMAQMGKKNLNLFQTLHKEKATKAKKAELPTRAGRGKDVKKVRVALLGSGSSSGMKGPEAGLIELLETVVRRDIEINLFETLVNSIDNMELNALVKATLIQKRLLTSDIFGF
ncbi:hypothetical protein DEO72_LG3g1916 [Vigna unguiculata]|uniref:Uncharacterized protein n=1 Tax=Vigna unguiculata TaxID=3917 RepID=A0A4D6LFH2_VIGUN|nr:hypothetical protein DEO72_LG3g1916 [Vigna unguiculata]